jgi:hypothetical protein
MRVNFSRQQKLTGIVPHLCSIPELHDRKSVVEGFECAFLSFAGQQMTEHKDRLPFPLDTEVLERALSTGRAGKLTG